MAAPSGPDSVHAPCTSSLLVEAINRQPVGSPASSPIARLHLLHLSTYDAICESLAPSQGGLIASYVTSWTSTNVLPLYKYRVNRLEKLIHHFSRQKSESTLGVNPNDVEGSGGSLPLLPGHFIHQSPYCRRLSHKPHVQSQIIDVAMKKFALSYMLSFALCATARAETTTT